MNDFFDRQEIAHRKTGRLIVLFVVAVILIVASVNLAAFAILRAGEAYSSTRRSLRSSYQIHLAQRPEPYIGVTVLTLGIIVCGSLYKIAMLSNGGGAAVAQLMGGRRILSASPAPEEKVLQNVVEEMSIASGVPVPQVWVMDEEGGINAFAAGFGTADAVVCVTRGCLQQLTRDELQGVIAHEFSHILNGDMRMNVRLAGILNGILVIGLLGYMIMRSLRFVRTSRSDKNGGVIIAILLFGVAIFVIGYVGLFFGRLIQAAVSRQREYLADASAVQFTRNPQGLASALKKIAGLSQGSQLESAHALEMAHLFFASGSKLGLTNLLATHPPLEERIRLLDPTFNGKIAEIQTASRYEGISPLAASQVVERAGSPQPQALQAATNLLASIPAPVQQAARDPFSARAMALTLLLSTDPAIRTTQAQAMRATIDAASANEAMRLAPAILPLDEASHIALMDLIQPALRQMSAPQLHELAQAAKGLIEADGRVTLFEYAMHRQLKRMLQTEKQIVQYAAFDPLIDEIVTVLVALSRSGNDESEAGEAFRAGAERLQLPQTIEWPRAFDLRAVDAALEKLSQSAPPIKRRVIDAAAHTVAHDGMIQPEEAALLRAICAALDVPLPIV